MVKFKEDDESYGIVRGYLREVTNHPDIAAAAVTTKAVMPTRKSSYVAIDQDNGDTRKDAYDRRVFGS